ncbi:unnamed protein product [Onchocerca flexuosa]|uniref:Uncharacterized protein n=1 Tax=Onchocerca flexuosa TaxID=387005 RepID=A0A183H279_9BILA|nr:unnamed protein product [Onchocerca flexuosa]
MGKHDKGLSKKPRRSKEFLQPDGEMAQSAEKDKEDKQTDGWMDCLIADSLINEYYRVIGPFAYWEG